MADLHETDIATAATRLRSTGVKTHLALNKVFYKIFLILILLWGILWLYLPLARSFTFLFIKFEIWDLCFITSFLALDILHYSFELSVHAINDFEF